MRNDTTQLRIREDVANAIQRREPVVALESTVLAHGLPYPVNLETARACEQAVGSAGALAATIGIAEGVPVIGLDSNELDRFAHAAAPDGRRIEKVNLSNFAAVLQKRQWGATTVAASLQLAFLSGLDVFSTGGIGGVHRGASESFDVSADLTALSRLPLVCVCAGAKSILDLAKTIERLETLGVPVVGFQTDEFPAFYSRRSGLPVDSTVAGADEAAELVRRHWASGLSTAVLVCVPAPAEFEIPSAEIELAISRAVSMAENAGVKGKALTPFLLSQIERMTGGKSLETNRALLINNSRVAASIAKSLATPS